MISVNFSLRRARAIRAAQVVLKETIDWDGEFKTPEEWEADLAQFDALDAEESWRRTRWRHAAAVWDAALASVKEIVRAVKYGGQIHFRDDPVRRHLFDLLRADGRNRSALYEQGKAALGLWSAADPAWKPRPGLDAEGFAALLRDCNKFNSAHAVRESLWRGATSALMLKARAVDADNTRWYGWAARIFPAGTAAGEMIRSTVPTTTRPRKSRKKNRDASGAGAETAPTPIVAPVKECAA